MSIPGFDQAQDRFDQDDACATSSAPAAARPPSTRTTRTATRGATHATGVKGFGRRTMSDRLSAVALLAVMLVPVCIWLAWLGGAA